MKKLNLIVIFVLILGITACEQIKNLTSQKKENLLDTKLLIGKWRSESDVKYIFVFEKESYTELYDKDTTDNGYYNVSSSCELKDSSGYINLQKAFLLLFSKKDLVEQCNEVINLNSDVFSCMNNKNGEICVFKKIQ